MITEQKFKDALEVARAGYLEENDIDVADYFTSTDFYLDEWEQELSSFWDRLEVLEGVESLFWDKWNGGDSFVAYWSNKIRRTIVLDADAWTSFENWEEFKSHMWSLYKEMHALEIQLPRL